MARILTRDEDIILEEMEIEVLDQKWRLSHTRNKNKKYPQLRGSLVAAEAERRSVRLKLLEQENQLFRLTPRSVMPSSSSIAKQMLELFVRCWKLHI